MRLKMRLKASEAPNESPGSRIGPRRRSVPIRLSRSLHSPRVIRVLSTVLHLPSARRRSTPAACAALALLAALPWVGAAGAHQDSDPKAPPAIAPPQPSEPESSPPAAEKADDTGWVEIPALSLRIRPPQPALGKSETVNGVFRYEIVEGGDPPKWWMRLQTLISSRSGQTADDQVKAYFDALTKTGKTFTVTINEALTPEGATGEGRLAIIESPLAEGGSGFSGWVIVPSGEDRYLVASLVLSASTLDTAIPALRETFRTMRLVDHSEIVTDRREKIERGLAMLRFSEETLRAALQPEPLLYRVYRDRDPNDPGDDTEVGWMTVRAIEAMRGEVNGSIPAEDLEAEEREKGFMVIVQAKTIIDGNATNVVDTESRYWVSWDRGSEVWSVRSTQRQRDAARTTGQTAVRTPPRRGDPRPILRVINASGMTEPLEWAVPPNYLSQAELIMLGRLLPRTSPNPEPYASYAFDPKTNGLPKRMDSFRQNPEGTWTLETKIGTNPLPLVQTFDAKGNRVRRVDNDAAGSVITELISPEALRSLWQRKGLPIQ
jgi:hypothetical protein